MNIIEAFKQSQGKNKIARKGKNSGGCIVFDGGNGIELGRFIKDLDSNWLIADDWEVVKEKKKTTYTFINGALISETFVGNGGNYSSSTCINIPKKSTVTIEYEE